MRITVIIPFKNEVKYLRDCFDSLDAQTCKDFSAIVVCDHCTEEALAEIKTYETTFPVKIMELPEDKHGVAAARNYGMDAADSEYVYFLDCDDYIEQITFEWMLERAENHDVIYGRRRRKTWYGWKTMLNNREKKRQKERMERMEQQLLLDDGEEQNLEDMEDRTMPEIHETDEEWVKTFCNMVKSNFMLTGLTALGILIRKDYLEKYNLRFDESYIYYSDLTFVTKLMSHTENVIEIRTIFYFKRRHNDPINMPALSQIEDEKVKLMETMRAYLTMKEDLKDMEERAGVSIDCKFIKYYVRKIARFYLQSEEPDEIQEIYEKAQECLPHIARDAKKRSMIYSRRLLKYSVNHTAEEIAVKVRRHSARQTLFRTIGHMRRFKKLYYRKVYVKKPIKENLVMFESFFGRNYSDSPKYIYEYLGKNYGDEYEFVWVLNKREKLPYGGKCVKRFSFKYFYYLAVCKYFVFNGRQPVYMEKRDGMVFLETWHGTPLKKLVFDMDDVTSATPLYKQEVYFQSRAWDYLVAPNKFSSDVFKNCFMYDGHMLDTGYPRNDILYLKGEEKENTINEIKAELGIPKEKKVILYAPTWRDDEFYDKGQYKFTLQLDLDKLREAVGDEYVVVLRTHYFIVDALNLKAYKGFAYNGSSYNDIARLYLISDILITDYSSVFFDYANLRRPMLFFTYDLEKYRGVLRGFYMDVEAELPGPMLFDTDEIIDSIKNIDQVEEKYKDKYDVFYEKYCGWENGTSTEKVVKAVFNK